MCNYCECEEFEKCSIVGYLPYRFCCENCMKCIEKQACINNKIQKTMPISSITLNYK